MASLSQPMSSFFLQLCTVMLVVVHLYVCLFTTARQAGTAVRRVEDPAWETKVDSYCSRSSEGTVPLVVEGGAMGFGIEEHQCRKECADSTDCKMYSFGRWEKGLSSQLGGYYGQMRCQHYASCDVKPQIGMTIFYKPEPEEPEAFSEAFRVPAVILMCFQVFVNVAALARHRWAGLCLVVSALLSSMYFALFNSCELPTVPLAVAHGINALMLAWLCTESGSDSSLFELYGKLSIHKKMSHQLPSPAGNIIDTSKDVAGTSLKEDAKTPLQEDASTPLQEDARDPLQEDASTLLQEDARTLSDQQRQGNDVPPPPVTLLGRARQLFAKISPSVSK